MTQKKANSYVFNEPSLCYLCSNAVSPFLRNLADLIEKFIQDFKSQGIPKSESDGDNTVLPSAGELFVFYKKCMVQCALLSTGTPLLSLASLFQKFLKEYANRLLTANLPK